ncbi:MAG: nicotinate-nucleotide adenylyltransferase [Bacteroidota bacterium]|nr:nicotinate-nucleotide adenylyltransferase [Bacteroidota bacterium]
MKKYGILGGTFNPPHTAHSIVADSVREQLKLDKIIFIPSGNPPLKESISAEHRLAMALLAFGKDRNFEVSDVEIQNAKEKSYSVNTLQKLAEFYKKDRSHFYFIIGKDNLIELPRWKEPHKLFELSEVIVINRPNYSVDVSKTLFADKVKFVNVPLLEISSSMIRDYVLKEKSIKYLVCKEVEDYIYKNNLYRM